MKLKFTFYSLLVVLLISYACGGPRTVTLNSMRPAEITLPSDIKTLLIVDRSDYKKGAVNIIEGILTGEVPGEDKSGAQALLNSLQNQLGFSSRFNVRIASERIKGNSLTAAFPDQLSWEQVEELTRKYHADALVSLEIFDSDFIITRGRKNIKERVGDQEVEALKYYAQGVGNITIGIRLYDAHARTIVDQQLLRNNHTWEAYGNSATEAIAQLVSKGEATRYLSNVVGSDYAYKVAPMPVKIRRHFRGKSKRSPELEQGTRYADVAQWGEAIEIWKSGLDHVRRDKEAGFLAYNIAIGYEVLGDIDSALTWAETSYTRHGNKDARNYVNLMRRKIRAEELARQQMELGYNQED